jgi:hypothetical protein
VARVGRFLTLIAIGATVALAAPPPQTAVIDMQGGVPGGIPQGRGQTPQIQPTPLVYTGVIMGRVIDPADSRPVAGAMVALQGGPSRAPLPPGAGRQAGPPPVPAPPPRVLTDSQGRFAFRQVPRGNYSLMASKSGYASGMYGQVRPNGPSRPLQLDDGEKVTDIALRIFKLAVMSGRVVDEAAEPVVGVTVRAFRRTLVSGRRVLTQAAQAQTDDRGEYRLPNLLPAEYVVSVPMTSTTASAAVATSQARQNFAATSQSMTSPRPALGGGLQPSQDSRFFWQPNTTSIAPLVPDGSGRWRAYATQYYPSARLATEAEPVLLASGEERTGLDFTMRFLPVSSISGRVMGLNEAASNFVLRLIPSDTGEFTNEMEVATTVADADGVFMFLGIPAGSYVVQVTRPAQQNFATVTASMRGGGPPVPPTPPAPPGLRPVQAQVANETPLLWGATPVSVGDSDVDGVAVQLHEGLTVSGRLEFTGSRPKPDSQRIQQIPIVIEPATGRQMQFAGPPSRTQPDGRFTTIGVVPGKYFLRVGGNPAGFMVQSIVANGVNAIDRPIELTSESLSGVVVSFTDLIASITGTIRDIEKSDEGAVAALFPADPAGWKEFGVNPVRFRLARATPTGAFNFGNLIAGEYFVVAIGAEYAQEWQDPAYLDVLSRTAQRITLTAGERRTIDLALTTAAPPGVKREYVPPVPKLPAPELRVPELQGAQMPVSEMQVPQMPVPHMPDAQMLLPHMPAPQMPDAQPQSPRDSRPTPAAGPSSISGRILIDDGSGPRPARLARVSVRSSRLGFERVALTDDEGRFTVAWLPIDDYIVSATKPAYLPLAYGARASAPMQGNVVKVAAGASVSGIDITLTRGAVLAGMVTDGTGQPAASVRVMAMQYVTRDGERLLSPVANGTTDDRGMFRLFGMRPGRFVLQVTPPSQGEVDLRLIGDEDIRTAEADASRAKPAALTAGATRVLAPAPADSPPAPGFAAGGKGVALAPVYYPGVVRADQASEIAVEPAQEVTGLHVQLQYLPAARISGTILDIDGQPAQTARVMLAQVSGTSTTQRSVRIANGRFLASGLAPGVYRLVVSISPGPGRPGQPGQTGQPSQYWAMRELEVFGDDIEQLVLQVAPPLTISGRVIFEGAPPPDPRGVQVRLETAGVGTTGMFPTTSVQPEADGTFVLRNVFPGRYRLVTGASPAGSQSAPWSILSSAIDGRDTLIHSFEVTDRSFDSASIVMTSQPAELGGTLLDAADRPVEGLFVLLFPVDPSLWSLTGSRVVRPGIRTGPTGTFRFAGVLPGQYFLAVATEIEQAAWGTPELMEQLAASAVKVTIGRGEKKAQNIKLAGRGSTSLFAHAGSPAR